MPRDTLLDFFDDRVQSSSVFLTYDSGFGSRSFTYDDVRRTALAFAGSLRAAGIGKADKVLIWGENRPEWVMAFWGCVLEGVVVVPLDYRASTDLFGRVMRIVKARGVVVGEEVGLPPLDDAVRIWRLAELMEPWPTARQSRARHAGTRPEQVSPEQRSHVKRDDVAEIIFTSGATAEPKGVVITHRNILANIVPVEREIATYRKYGRPFFPLRFLNLLPLSHLFGQAMAIFIPPMLPGVVIFMHGYNPNEIVRQLKTRRVSVLVCVPKILDVLRGHILRLCQTAGEMPPDKPHIIVRWWRHRKVHRLLGWKFWSFVVGAAPLDPPLEEFWSRLGFLVVQGYGLTETAPIVTLNHPLKARKGTVGVPLAGVEVKIAPDGEILVRGENVTSGYYQAAEETAAAFTNGWFRTGDIGVLDDTGRLIVRGRKKEVIVTPEGLNVFPEDVERAINDLGGVRESAVVGMAAGGEERAHAVLVLEPGIEPGEIVRQANARLEDHQKIRGVSVWSAGELPRTEGTKKLKRRDIRWWVEAGESRAADARAPRDTVEAIVGQFAGRRAVTGETTLDELGLSSLERLELMMGARGVSRDVDRRNVVRRGRQGQRPTSARRAATRSRNHSCCGRFPVSSLESKLDRSGDPPGKPIDVDSSACARVCLGTYRRIDESGLDRGPCPVRGEPPEPLGHSGHPRRAPDARTLPGSPRHGQGVFQGALPSGAAHAARVAYQQSQLLPGCAVFQRVSLTATGSGNVAGPSLHR